MERHGEVVEACRKTSFFGDGWLHSGVKGRCDAELLAFLLRASCDLEAVVEPETLKANALVMAMQVRHATSRCPTEATLVMSNAPGMRPVHIVASFANLPALQLCPDHP